MNRKDNSERVRGRYTNDEIVIVGAVDKPIEQTDILPRLIRSRNPSPLVVTVDDDLRAYYPDAAAVNKALRLLATETERGKSGRRPRTSVA